MKFVSLEETEKRLGLKEKALSSIESTEEIMLILLLTKNGVELNNELAKLVSENLDFEIPVIKGLIDGVDVECRSYDIELLKLTAFLLAKSRGDDKVNEVVSKYEDFKKEFNHLYEEYDEEASEILNLTIDKVKKINKINNIYDLQITHGEEETSLYQENTRTYDTASKNEIKSKIHEFKSKTDRLTSIESSLKDAERTEKMRELIKDILVFTAGLVGTLAWWAFNPIAGILMGILFYFAKSQNEERKRKIFNTVEQEIEKISYKTGEISGDIHKKTEKEFNKFKNNIRTSVENARKKSIKDFYSESMNFLIGSHLSYI